MEYIAHEDLEQFSAYLTDLVVGSSRLNAKIEGFTSRYRKPSRIGRSRTGKKGEVAGPTVCSSEKFDCTVPSYLATGILLDGIEPIYTRPGETESVSQVLNHHDHFMPATITSISSIPVVPRRQRSFSLGSCYSMRKPTRRRTNSLGDLSEPSSRVLLMDMIAALNEAFPDYDFGDSKKEQFKEQELHLAMRLINGYFAELNVREPQLLEKLWSAIDDIVNLKNCEVFQYLPNDDDDSDNYLWYFHYFFFNKELHTLCYFNCSADRYYTLKAVHHIIHRQFFDSILRRKLDSINESDDDEDGDMDCEMEGGMDNLFRDEEDDLGTGGVMDYVDENREDDDDEYENSRDW